MSGWPATPTGFHLDHLKELFLAGLDLVFPVKCVVCGEIQPRYLCVECREQVKEIAEPICEICGGPCLDRVCSECRESPPLFAFARAVGDYEGVLRDAIHALKYNGKTPVAPELAELMTLHARSHPGLTEGVDLVMPAPIHLTRERVRGFSQSELLAAPLANALGIGGPRGALVRIRPTKPQVGLKGDERRRNVRNSFAVVQPEAVQGRTVLLVDDVLTTGSTANDAARALIEAGAKSVRVFTLAR